MPRPRSRPRRLLPRAIAAGSAALVAAGVGLATTGATAVAPRAQHQAAAAPRLPAAPAAVRAAPAATATALDAGLTRSLRSRMSGSTAASWSAVVDIAGRGRVVSVAGGSGLRPASTEKLFTTLPILLSSPAQRLSTVIGSTQAPVGGVLHADLVVSSSGDPSLRKVDVTNLAKRLHDAGVRKVTGRLVLDIGDLPTVRVRPQWKSSYVPDDIAPLSPFPVGGDLLHSTAGYLAHPTSGNIAFLRSQLTSAGVSVAGTSVVARHVSMPHVFTAHRSPTMAALVQTTLLDSVNFYAEQLLSIEGRGAVTATSNAAGVTSNSSSDGSGLSLNDRTSAASEVALLEYATRSAAAGALRASLPLACRTGTLKHLLCATLTAGKVWAKTGTLDGTKCLAGYTTDAKGRVVTFAILTNGDRSTATAMTAMSKVLALLRTYRG